MNPKNFWYFMLYFYQDPIQVTLGSDQITKTVRGQQKLVDVTDSFTYIPLLLVLQAMLKNDKIYEEVFY